MKIKGLIANSGIKAAMGIHWRMALFVSFFCAFVLVAAFQAHAQNKVFTPLTLTSTTTEVPIGPKMIVQKDIRNQVSEARIRATMGGVLTGKISDDEIINLGYDGASYWLSFKLLNNSSLETWMLDMGEAMKGRTGHINTMRVFEMPLAFPGNAQRPEFYLKELTPSNKNGLYKIQVQRSSQKLIVLNVRAAAGLLTSILPTIQSEDKLFKDIESRGSHDAFFSLALIGFTLLFLVLAFIHRKLDVLIFAGYFGFLAFSCFFYKSAANTIAGGAYKDIILLIVLIHSILCLVTTKVFCQIDHNRPGEKYILYGLMVLSIFSAVVSFLIPSGNGTIHVSIMYGIPFSCMFVCIIMAYAQIFSGRIKGYAYCLSWIFPFIGFIILVLTTTETIPFNAYSPNALWYSFIPQGIFLMLALDNSLKSSRSVEQLERSLPPREALNLDRLKQTKEEGDHSRLLRVIEKERELLADLRQKEEIRMQEMRRAKEEADEANRAKSAFLAVVSHEIRTPMTGIMGMVRMLLDSNINKQQKDYVMTIQESGDAMLGLLNDILDFEKIQRGKMELENISFDLHRLIQGVITLMSGHAAEKSIMLSARVDDDLPRYVKGDPTRIRQVLLNLMGNALKFTDKGNVTLIVKNMQGTEGQTANNNFMIYFAVTDTGIGISESAQKNLFSPFAQADSTIARKFGGSGLGLAISKGLIEAMGSSVNINSQPGEGSTFFFTLKMDRGISSTQETSKKAPEQMLPATPIDPLRILVVDDNTINRKVIGSFLAQDNHFVTTSTTAEDALHKIDIQPFDLVLMDIELPGISGNEATKILRGNEDKKKASIPVIALTGNVGTEDLEQYLADGMNGLIAKPIDPDKLRSIIVEIATHSFEREIKSPVIETLPIPDAEPIIPAVPMTNEELRIFNPQMLQSLKDAIGMDQLQQLLDELITKTDEILAAMGDAAKASDMENLFARAHELKGMAGNFGLVEISEIAESAEKKAKGSETTGLGDLIESLPAASLRAQSALKNWAERAAD